MISPKSEEYYKQLQQKRLNTGHHIAKIVGLSEIYGVDAVANAMESAFRFHAYSSEYIANILEQQKRILPEPGALHLTYKKELLDLSIEQPNMELYDNISGKGDTE